MELPDHISIALLKNDAGYKLSISADAHERITHNRNYLDKILDGSKTYYGINTGFGSLCNVRIKEDELSQLQENLVCSHACGMGDEVPGDIVRLMLLLKVHGLSQGYSGVRPEIVYRLTDFYSRGITPIVYELGSLGASGDLAPLAHLSLPLFGKGEVRYKGIKIHAAEALKAEGLQPITLSAKEGLALLNGTQFMSAYWPGPILLARFPQMLLWSRTSRFSIPYTGYARTRDRWLRPAVSSIC